MRAYANSMMQIRVEDLGFNNFQFPVSVFSLSKDNGIKFNQQHNNENCKEQDARVNYVKRCSACGLDLHSEDMIKVFRLDKENKAYFSDAEIKAIKKVSDKIEIIAIALSRDIPDYFKSGSYGLSVAPKSKTLASDKQAYNTLISFLGEELNLVGYFSSRNATHLVRIFALTNYLLMQKLAFAESSQFDEFMELHKAQIGSAVMPDMAILQGVARSIAKPIELTDFHNEPLEKMQELIESRIKNPSAKIELPEKEKAIVAPIFSKEYQQKIAEQLKVKG